MVGIFAIRRCDEISTWRGSRGVEGVRVEGRERADRRRAGRHRVRVLRQRAEDRRLEVLVEHRVPRDRTRRSFFDSSNLAVGGSSPVDQQVGDLEEGAVLGQFLDRNAAVAEDALLAVDEGDRCCMQEPGVRRSPGRRVM